MSDTNVLEVIERDYAKSIAADPNLLLEVPARVFSFEEEFRSKVSKQKTLHECGKEYKSIDLSFLKMRNKDGLPKFAVFSLDSKYCYFDVECSRDIIGYTSNISEQFIKKNFVDIFEKLGNKAINKFQSNSNKVKVSLLSAFDGLIPEPVRKKINDVRDNMSMDRIYVIKEATNWLVDTIQKMVKKM